MPTLDSRPQEVFKPVAIKPPSENRLLFVVRCIADLQLFTVYRFLKEPLRRCRGRLLDVGAGEAPWREFVSQAEYVGVDIESSTDFGMRRRPDVAYYSGDTLPYPDNSFDNVLCTEVLEHVREPKSFLLDLHRVLRSNGTLILTVPWSARLHHLPHDYARYTPAGLSTLLESAGFSVEMIEQRGNEVASIANKLLVLTIRLFRARPWYAAILTWPLGLIAAPLAMAFIGAAHISIALGLRMPEDPLGYGVIARRR